MRARGVGREIQGGQRRECQDEGLGLTVRRDMLCVAQAAIAHVGAAENRSVRIEDFMPASV
ncbi:hypothetical protein AA3990_0627 [Gluconobacter roseus NBRC 3990]|nr:hypothetical protein AA3990_0627 [Gluconobacter roseus NBRC 3990]